MAVFERSTSLPTELDTAWDFHHSVQGLLHVSPDWLSLQLEGMWDAEGTRVEQPSTATPLRTGAVVHLSMQPLGRGPRLHWRSRIDEANCGDGTAVLRDRMVEGPFDHWVHTHSLYADGDETVLRDHVEYRLTERRGGTVVDRAAVLGLDPMFRFRHRRTRSTLSGGWTGWDE